MLQTEPITPSLHDLARSQTLVQQIRQAIDQQGPLTFDHYMELALYHPTLGYYCIQNTLSEIRRLRHYSCQ